jgi:aerobic C4-dicarboxylate transport protein
VALLLGADRLMDSMRVVVNLLGNCVATFVVSKWEGQFDRSVMVRAFRGEITNHDSAVMLGVEENFQEQELERISRGGQASPKFRGGPNPGEMPEFQMSRPSAAINHE